MHEGTVCLDRSLHDIVVVFEVDDDDFRSRISNLLANADVAVGFEGLTGCEQAPDMLGKNISLTQPLKPMDACFADVSWGDNIEDTFQAAHSGEDLNILRFPLGSTKSREQCDPAKIDPQRKLTCSSSVKRMGNDTPCAMIAALLVVAHGSVGLLLKNEQRDNERNHFLDR